MVRARFPTMKTTLKILGGLLVLLLVALLAASAFLGGIVQTAVNTAGPKITGTKVEVKSVRLSVFSGSCAIEGLAVGNTEGWKEPNAFYLGKIDAKVSLSSLLFGDHIVIEKIEIESPEVDYETNVTSSNLKTLQANIEQNTKGAEPAGGEKPSGTQQPAAEGKPVKVEIRHFSLTGVKVKASTSGILGEKSVALEVPSVVLEDIGTKEGGVTPAQAAMSIVKNLTTQVAKAATEGAANALKEDPKAVKGAVKDAVKGVKDLFKK